MSIIRHNLKQRLNRARIARFQRQSLNATLVQSRAASHVDRASAGIIDY